MLAKKQRGDRRDLWVLWVDATDMIVTIVGTSTSHPGWSEVEDRTEVLDVSFKLGGPVCGVRCVCWATIVCDIRPVL